MDNTLDEAQAIIAQARAQWAGDDLEIDDRAPVSETGDKTGHWVQAWVFVPNPSPR